MVLPAQDINKQTMEKIRNICYAIGKALMVSGPFNMQLIAKVIRTLSCRTWVCLLCIISSNTGSIRDSSYWISREKSFELVELFSMNIK
jgi:hypothetical protein